MSLPSVRPALMCENWGKDDMHMLERLEGQRPKASCCEQVG